MTYSKEEVRGHSLDRCLEKFKHLTYASAVGHATKMLKTTGTHLNVYLCPFKDDHWHVGRAHK